MTQGKRRSRGYISFLTCNDPKGVAEHGTVRVSRVTPKSSNHQDKNEQHPRRKHKDLNTLLAEERQEEEEEMGISKIREGGSWDSNHFQLMQVTQETQKPTHWANGLSREVQTKDIAKNLLEGAFDFQASLVALRRLQETQNVTPRLDKRGEQKLDREGFDGEGVLNLVQIKDDKYMERFHLRSRSVEELKKVIREGLKGRNVGGEEPYGHVRLDSSPSNMPSTSSSQATTTNSSSFNSSDSSLSSTASQKTTEKSNLVAKLMGLEAMPSSPRRQTGNGTLSNLRRPLFDIDLPMLRQPQFPTHRANNKDETIDGVLETMRLKGLLKRSASDPACPSSHHLWSDDTPPIVVIKPLPYSPSLEDTVIAKPDNGACNGRPLMRPRSRGEGTAKSDLSIAVNNLSEVEVNSGPTKPRYQGGNGRKQGREKTEGIVAIAKEKRNISSKKRGVPVHGEPPKKPVVGKRNNEVHKTAAATKKGVETKTAKSGNETTSQASSDLHHSKPKRQEKGSQRGRIYSQQSTNDGSNSLKRVQLGSKKTVMKRAASTGDQLPQGTNTGIKRASDKNLISEAAETLGGEGFSGVGVMESETQIRDIKGEKASLRDEIMLMNTQEDITDGPTDSHDSFYEIIVTNPKDGTHGDNLLHGLNEEANLAQRNDDGLSSSKEVEMRASSINDSDSLADCHAKKKLKAILVSSPFFISRAEELFDLEEDLNLMMTLTSCHPKPSASNSKVLVDYANQLLELESRQRAQASLPVSHPLINIHLKSTISTDELLDEICDMIEVVRCYCKPSIQTISVDGLTTLLARDMKYAGTRDEMWDIGWRTAFSVDEVERIVCETEKLILAGLIQEALEDFMH